MDKSLLSIRLGGKLRSLEHPMVMAILNVTPDSFYASSRCQNQDAVRSRVRQMIQDGADILDMGACSTRPGSTIITEQEELERLRMGLEALRDEDASFPVSVDTFRSSAARMAVEEYGAVMINDVSSGDMDAEMFPLVARLQVPYVIMHLVGSPFNPQMLPESQDATPQLVNFFFKKLSQLRELGAADVILDPGFGFSKTLEQNYRVLAQLEDLTIFGQPILCGLSRKSMITRVTGTVADQAAAETVALDMAALERGADILRVHDVREAVSTVRLYEALLGKTKS